jgi:DNA anti-recombination protein RmuC
VLPARRPVFKAVRRLPLGVETDILDRLGVYSMKRRVWNEPATLLLTALLVVACDRTAEGVKQDTAAATASASDTAEQARQSIDSQMSAFKAQTSAKLDELNVAVQRLSADTSASVSDSKQKLQLEIEETKAKLGQLSAQSGDQLEQAKTDLGARLEELRKRLNDKLDQTGDKVDETLHRK